MLLVSKASHGNEFYNLFHKNRLPFAFISYWITSLGVFHFLHYKVHPCLLTWFYLPLYSPLIIHFQIQRNLNYSPHLLEKATPDLRWVVPSVPFFFIYHNFVKMEDHSCAQYMAGCFTAEFNDVFSFLLLSSFLTEYLVFNNYWALIWHLQKTIECDPKVLSLHGNSKLGTCQYICIVRVVFPLSTSLCIYQHWISFAILSLGHSVLWDCSASLHK